jgi:lipopolysaccharide export system protein LptA
MKRFSPLRCGFTSAAFVALALAAAAALADTDTHTVAPVVDTKSKAPIDVTANEAEVIQSKCVAIWRGAAEAVQDQARLRADTITVYSVPKGVDANGQQSCGATDRLVADGNVYYVTPQQNARGDHAVYSQTDDEIVVTGNVVVVQGKDVARGDKLTIKVSTRDARLESNVTGPGKTGRVRGVFYPNKDNSTAEASKP